MTGQLFGKTRFLRVDLRFYSTQFLTMKFSIKKKYLLIFIVCSIRSSIGIIYLGVLAPFVLDIVPFFDFLISVVFIGWTCLKCNKHTDSYVNL